MPLDVREEHRMLQHLVAKFVDEVLMPLEAKIIEPGHFFFHTSRKRGI